MRTLSVSDNTNNASASSADNGGCGHKGEAIEYYRRAIDAYDKLIHSYPGYSLNSRYKENVKAYQRRIQWLERYLVSRE